MTTDLDGMACCICRRSARGFALFRVNEKGKPGIWACEAHIGLFPNKQPDQVVLDVVAAVKLAGETFH